MLVARAFDRLVFVFIPHPVSFNIFNQQAAYSGTKKNSTQSREELRDSRSKHSVYINSFLPWLVQLCRVDLLLV